MTHFLWLAIVMTRFLELHVSKELKDVDILGSRDLLGRESRSTERAQETERLMVSLPNGSFSRNTCSLLCLFDGVFLSGVEELKPPDYERKDTLAPCPPLWTYSDTRLSSSSSALVLISSDFISDSAVRIQ